MATTTASYRLPSFLTGPITNVPSLSESGNLAVPVGVVQDVNCHNLEEEMQKISRLATRYPFIALDTEFPGVLDIPMGTFETCADYEYALFKSNVDQMNIIQLGMSFFDADGRQPSPVHTWQFNFRFNLADELYAQDSIQMLMESGIDFAVHQSAGIEPNHFAERLVTSGIICNEAVKFLTFHAAYDFGYLYKILEGRPTLPASETGFLDIIRMYFPQVYDIKFMLKDNRTLKGGLQDLANFFRLTRTGNQHQAGSDSALTGSLFFRLKRDVFPDHLDQFRGQIYGLSGVLALDRVRRLENVIIRKNTDGSIHMPTAVYGIKLPTTSAFSSSDLSQQQYLSRITASPTGLSAVFAQGSHANNSECPAYLKMAAGKSGFAQSLSLSGLPHQYSDSYSSYGSHNGTVYFS